MQRRTSSVSPYEQKIIRFQKPSSHKQMVIVKSQAALPNTSRTSTQRTQLQQHMIMRPSSKKSDNTTQHHSQVTKSDAFTRPASNIGSKSKSTNLSKHLNVLSKISKPGQTTSEMHTTNFIQRSSSNLRDEKEPSDNTQVTFKTTTTR